MPLGFYTIMAAQFFSALADNALLIIAIASLRDLLAPPQHEPLLKLCFTLSYVLLAAFVGAFADSKPKAQVMLICNGVKVCGCLLFLLGCHPLLAYAVVGLGAAAYSPAKYGILTEYLPHRLLVVANGWIEGLTVAAIVLGTLVGGILILPFSQDWLQLGLFNVFPDALLAATCVVGLLYLVAAIFNLFIPDTGVDHKPLKRNPLYLLHDFHHCFKLLWRDKLGQISLTVTTLFWGAGATLQFIVIRWAENNLEFELAKASMLQGVVAVGVALGAIAAARLVSLKKATKVMPFGIAMGLLIMLITCITQLPLAIIALIFLGAFAGFFVVPMNALLQHRGHILMGAGHSIAVQNFNENLSILAMTGAYALLLQTSLSINSIIVLFGLFMAASMVLVSLWHRQNQRQSSQNLLSQKQIR